MGGRNSPQVWGRAAALLARILQGLLPQQQCRLQVYVDDPIVTTCGTRAERSLHLAAFMLALTVIGCQLAWQKGARAAAVSWIGASFAIDGEFLLVSAKRELLVELDVLVCGALEVNTIT
eukprot:6130670-Amphidinium_carterae.1